MGNAIANRSALMYSFEDLREELSYSGERNNGDHESLLVPAEEIEEEAPLRIRTLQYQSDAQSNVINIDLSKYIKQNTS